MIRLTGVWSIAGGTSIMIVSYLQALNTEVPEHPLLDSTTKDGKIWI